MGQFRLVSLQLPILRNSATARGRAPAGGRAQGSGGGRVSLSSAVHNGITPGGIALIAVTRFVRAFKCRLSNCVPGKLHRNVCVNRVPRNERLMRRPASCASSFSPAVFHATSIRYDDDDTWRPAVRYSRHALFSCSRPPEQGASMFERYFFFCRTPEITFPRTALRCTRTALVGRGTAAYLVYHLKVWGN